MRGPTFLSCVLANLNFVLWFFQAPNWQQCGIVDRAAKSVGQGRERERDLYFSVVTGTHYGTKTPPDNTSSLRRYAQGYDKTRRYLQYVFEYGL